MKYYPVAAQERATFLIILAAGRGTRMEGIVRGPKPLADVGGEPLLQRNLRQFHEIGIKNACVVVGHKATSVSSIIRSSYPDTNILYNEKYSHDRNIYSLLLALRTVPKNACVIVLEGDVVLADKSVLKLLPLFHGDNSIWVACGLFHESQTGGIIKADKEGNIQEIRYSTYMQNLACWYKNLGLLIIRPSHVDLFCNLLESYAEKSLDYYFMTPWQEHLDILPAKVIDVGRDGGRSFNTPEEYVLAQKIVSTIYPRYSKMILHDVDKMKHIENFDKSRVKWLLEKIVEEGFWNMPLAVSWQHNLVMDGQHRLEVARHLGLRRIPVVFFDYMDIDVYSLRPDYEVSVQSIIERALAGDIYPYKTAKHILPPLPYCHISLKELY